MSGTVKPEDIEALVELFQSSDWDEMHLEVEGLEIFLSNDPKARLESAPVQPQAASAAAGETRPALSAPSQAAAAAAPGPERASEVPAHWIVVTAPNLGTFYRAPKPGAAPFVELDQTVTAETEICLIEVMKLFTAVRAGTAGTVRRITVADGEMVEYGQTLFFIEPA